MTAAATLEAARAAKPALVARLAGHPAVNGVGIAREGEGHVLRVNLREEATAGIPDDIDGVPVRTRVVGPLRARGGEL